MDRILKQFLDASHVPYRCIEHFPTFTALATAHSAHVAEAELAKAVILRVDGQLMMAVVPASHNVDLEKVASYIDAESVELADEYEFDEIFLDCQPGAMPALGNLYGVRVIAADVLLDDDEIAFNAGTHDEVVKMKFCDFIRLAKPLIGQISEPRPPTDAGEDD